MQKPSTAAIAWLAGWLATLAITLWLLSVARQQVIADLSRPEARADWQRWKQDETQRQQQGNAPVRRRAPKSDVPPALILMRDSFPAIAGISLMVVSLLASLALFVVWIMGWYARRVGESSQDPSMMIDPAELRRLREIAEARRANAVPPSEPPAP